MSLDGSRFLNLESDIKSSCGCLVKIDDNKVRLSHNTVKQFLLESAVFRDHPLRARYIDTNGADYIADVCTKYIFHHKFRVPLIQGARFGITDISEIRGIYPFLEYAAIHWVNHCRNQGFPPNSYLTSIIFSTRLDSPYGTKPRVFSTSTKAFRCCSTSYNNGSYLYTCRQIESFIKRRIWQCRLPVRSPSYGIS